MKHFPFCLKFTVAYRKSLHELEEEYKQELNNFLKTNFTIEEYFDKEDELYRNRNTRAFNRLTPIQKRNMRLYYRKYRLKIKKLNLFDDVPF